MKLLPTKSCCFLTKTSVLSVAFSLLLPLSAHAQQGIGANYETRLSGLEDEFRALNGQVEQLSYAIHRLDQGVQRMQADYDSRLSKLETGVANLTAAAQAAPPTPPAVANVAGEVNNPPLAAVKVQDGKVTGSTIANNGTPPLPEGSAATDNGGKALSAQEQYDRAFNYLRQANYDDAEKAFKAFIAANPKDKLIDNAKYWYAETLYVRGRFTEAAVGFADAFQQNPQGTKAPDSLLKLAMSLGAANKIDDACTALSELKTKYPTASPTIKTRASEERTKLKCGSN